MVLELNSLGVTGSMPLLLLAVYNSWAALLNYVNALLIDRIGRIRIITIGLVLEHELIQDWVPSLTPV